MQNTIKTLVQQTVLQQRSPSLATTWTVLQQRSPSLATTWTVFNTSFHVSTSLAQNSKASSLLSNEKNFPWTHFMTRKISFSSKHSNKMPSKNVLDGFDAIQVKLMEEECILVDADDNNIGSASKKDCHLLENINKGMLHRAFSCFLFNTKGELLLQQRAEAKITFPDHFTNTCCSHPLNRPLELEEKDAIGVRRAAQRKLDHELGIKAEQIPLDDFYYLTRILYKAENIPADGKWGEHEIDYALIIQKDVDVHPNPNEVKSYRYVSKQELKDFMKTAEEKGILITPWFRLLVENFLYKWWDNLDNLENFTDRGRVYNLV